MYGNRDDECDCAPVETRIIYRRQRPITAAEAVRLRPTMPIPELFDAIVRDGALTVGEDPVVQTYRRVNEFRVNVLSERPATSEDVRRWGS